MNQIPAALMYCQSFLKEDTAVLEEGQKLKTTVLYAKDPSPQAGDKEATGMDSTLHHNTSPIQK